MGTVCDNAYLIILHKAWRSLLVNSSHRSICLMTLQNNLLNFSLYSKCWSAFFFSFCFIIIKTYCRIKYVLFPSDADDLQIKHQFKLGDLLLLLEVLFFEMIWNPHWHRMTCFCRFLVNIADIDEQSLSSVDLSCTVQQPSLKSAHFPFCRQKNDDLTTLLREMVGIPYLNLVIYDSCTEWACTTNELQ